MSAENEYAFNEKYEGSEIEAVGRIFMISSSSPEVAVIYISCWNFAVVGEYESLLPDLREGTLVKFRGKLWTGRGVGSGGSFYIDDVDTFEIIEEK